MATIPELTAALAPYLGRTPVEMVRRQRMLREDGFFLRGRHGRAAQPATDSDAVTLLLGTLAAIEPIGAPAAVRAHASLVPARYKPASPPNSLVEAAGSTLAEAFCLAMKNSRCSNDHWAISKVEVHLHYIHPDVNVTFVEVINGITIVKSATDVRYYTPATHSLDWFLVPDGFNVTAIRTKTIIDGLIFKIMADILDGRIATEEVKNNAQI